MTAPAPSLSPAPIANRVEENPPLSVAELDRSCRLPVLFLFSAAAAWLGIGALLALITAIGSHAPLGGPAWFTYGRIRPVSANALVYGFSLQAGIGAALWMFCRLGRCMLVGPWVISAGVAFWNLGLLLGAGLILNGGSTGYEWLEFPRAAAPVLFLAYLLMAGLALITLHTRRERPFYVSQWFLVAALLWFPWVYSTAQLLLVFQPLRGIMQAVVHGWYVHNFFELCLAPFALAAICYLLPKLTNRPLHSRGLALFAFWFLVLFGGWGGLRVGQPVPNWISGVSVVARVFMLLPVIALGLSWYRTAVPGKRLWRTDLTYRFVIVAAVSYVLAAVLDAIVALPDIAQVTSFTIFDQGLTQLRLHGVLGMALLAGVYHILPRVTGVGWPSAALVRVHFWSAVVGTTLVTLALLVGGVIQGLGINEPGLDFVKVMKRMLPFLGTGTLGTTLLLVGYGAFIVHIGRILWTQCGCFGAFPGVRENRATHTGRARA
jgi:cytochrome c oxidase cbb3-type subunit I